MAAYAPAELHASRTVSMISVAAYRASDVVEQAAIEFRHHVARARTRRALSRLSDRQLEDIGTSRPDIAAFSERAGRR